MAKENVKREIMVIEGKYKLVETNLDWQIYRFDEGGKEVRSPSTGEVSITVPRWVALQAYYNKTMHLKQALGHILQLAVVDSLDGTHELSELISRYENSVKTIQQDLKL